MISKIYTVPDVDQPLIDGMVMLSKHGIEITVQPVTAVAMPVQASSYQDYFFPDRDRHVTVTLHTAEQAAIFDEWLKKEQFRFSLKGKRFLTLVAIDEAIPWP